MPKVPKSRLVLSTDGAMSTQRISAQMSKDIIFTKRNKKLGVMRFLSNRAKQKRRRKLNTQRGRDFKMKRPFKHHKPQNSFFRFKRLETLVKNKHSQMKHWSKCKQRLVSKNKCYKNKLMTQLKYIPILIIVRIHRQKNIPKKVLAVMLSLKLMKPFQCVIVRNSIELQNKLIRVLPYVTFGVPSPQLVNDLVMKRGKLRFKKHSAAIKSNLMIEQKFGKYDIICVQDIMQILIQNPYAIGHRFAPKGRENVHVDLNVNQKGERMLSNGKLVESTEIFDCVTQCLNPFQLNKITIPIKGLTAPFDHKGYWGYRGNHINTFVEKIL